MAIEVVDRSGGERLSDGPVTLRILEDGSHTGHRIGVVEGTLPPRTGGPPEHVHRQHDETFFVVSGSPTFTSGGNTITAQPRTLVAVPAGRRTPSRTRVSSRQLSSPPSRPPSLSATSVRSPASALDLPASTSTRSPRQWPDTPQKS